MYYLNLTFGSALYNTSFLQENFQLSTLLPADFENVLNTEIDALDAKDIVSYAGKTLEKLTLRNQILTDEFGRLSTFTD